MKEKFIIRNEDIRKNCIEFISKMDITTPITVNIYDYKKNRTLDQNDLYWLWIEQLCDYNGDTKDAMHRIMRARHLPLIFDVVDGIKTVELTSTTSLNTKEFSDYLKEIEVELIDNGIKPKYPEELIYILKQ